MKPPKVKTKVILKRSELAPSLACQLPSFIFWNPGTVQSINGNRVAVAWPGTSALWFDADQIGELVSQ